MLKKLFVLSVAIGLSSASYCDNTHELALKRDKDLLKSKGIEILDGEIKIVKSFDYLKSTQGLKQDAGISESISRYLSMHAEMSKNGYVKDNNPRAQELMNFNDRFKAVQSIDPQNEDLKKDIGEIKMAYTFAGVPTSLVNESYGYAPFGAYKEIKNGDEGDGWDGAVQFFKSAQGVCAYTEQNLKLAHGGVELIEELTTYDVNHKPTVVLVSGNKASGYTYKISWYDNTFAKELECASQQYSSSLKQSVINMANNIDTYNG